MINKATFYSPVLIQGGFYAFTTYANLVDTDRLIEIVGTLSDRILTQNLFTRQ